MKVKDLAKLCGVSEQAIRQFYSRNNFTKVNGKWQPTEQEIESLLSYYQVNVSQVAKADESPIESDSDVISILGEQLSALQEQLKIKDQQIEELQSTISKQQGTIDNLIETNSNLVASNKALAATTALNTAAEKKELLLEQPSEQEQEVEQPRKRTFKEWWHDLWNG